jgi:copper chaperone
VLVLKVEDMTCGHCASAVAGRIESEVPGATVDVDLASKLVTVRGIPDVAAIEAAIASAGYTPTRMDS